MNNSLNILLVDDQQALLFTYTLILQKQGHRVVAVSGRDQAIQHLEQENFDLLICDLSLEAGCSGFEVLDFAKHYRPDMRQVLLTGFVSLEIEQEAKRRGITILFKPVGVPQLLEMVHIQGRARVPAAMTELRPGRASDARLPRQITS